MGQAPPEEPSEMAGPFILAERGASQMRRGLRRIRPGAGGLPSYAGAEDRSYASPESLFMDEYERLARAITLISHDPDVARDAVQEAFARLCREWPTVSGYQHQAAWVRKVALNLLRDQQRQSGRRARLFVSLEQMQQDSEDLAWDGFASFDIPADGDPDLWRAVRQLPEKQKTAIGLFYIADLNVSEVAAAMGVSQGTVKRHLDRARNTIRTKMEA
jgi:RNA polymerase sigma-70 factor (ECF subfamily)